MQTFTFCVMETYGKILLIAMPIFLLLVLLEKWYGIWQKKETVESVDAISSLTSGVTNVTKDVLQIGITILSYEWLVNNLAIYKLENTIAIYIIAFIALDFTGYCAHRIQHRINFFWNYHLIHHSSENFNLACALRQSISGLINVFSFFLLPAALLGVPAQVIATVAPLHLFAQFWYHTEHIKTMGFLEHIIVTPSHHRVHHAINPEYIDKNYSQIFIVWDKLFGTFQKELDSIPPVYGITVPVSTWNPIKINFQHLALLAKDCWRSKNWWDKIRVWFMPTGWRPADVAEKFPIHKIENVYNFEKYQPPATKQMIYWYWILLLGLLALLIYFFGHLGQMRPTEMFIYGAYIFVYIYAFTDLMDTNKSAMMCYTIQLIFCINIFVSQNDWFGAAQNVHAIFPFMVLLFNIVSFVAAIIFNKQQQQLKTKLVV